MADRRMFSKRIIKSARFLKMPISVQALYFHLGLEADDDGVVEAYMVMKSIGCTEDDLKILVAKGYVKVLNEDLVTYIVDWTENNKIRADRKKESIYRELLNGIMGMPALPEPPQAIGITEVQPTVNQMTTNCQPNDNQVTTKCQTYDSQLSAECPHRIGKDRIGKDRIGEDRVGEVIGEPILDPQEDPSESVAQIPERIDYKHIVELYHEYCPSLPKVAIITDARRKAMKAILKKYTLDQVINVFEIAEQSPFIRGECNSPGHERFTGNFDFLMKEKYFVKTLEGCYSNNKGYQKTRVQQDLEAWDQMLNHYVNE